MIALIWFVLAVLASPFESKSRLEAENAVLRHQLIVLRRKVRDRAQPTNNDRWFLVLMSDLILTRLGVTAGDLVVEGSLAANRAYAALLAAFRPSQQVFAGSDAAGTARGAALLAKWPPRNFQPPPLIAAPPCAIEGLHAYRNVWTKAVLER
jgi:hypothetical protein